MLNRSLLKEVQQRLDGTNSSLQGVRSSLYLKLSKDEIAECDGCGCLLKKNAKFKQPSTVETIIQERQYGYSGPCTNYPPESIECIVEHYMCFKCSSQSVAKNPAS